MNAELRGPRELRSEVESKHLCTLCGACVDICPYWVAYRGRIVALDECSLSQGRCYAHCPRTPLDLDELHRTVFGASRATDEVGTVREIVMSRAGDAAIRSRGQYGGTVSALMSFALREGRIDSAVLTSTDEELLPSGTAARDEAGVLACTGSNFVAAPTLASFNREAATDARRIGVVATPCQVLALAKMRTSPLRDGSNIGKLKLVVGLFCTWALGYEDFARFLQERIQLAEITRSDVPPPPANVFDLHTKASRVSIPLDEVRRFIRPTCEVCIDMTAELADLSVGAAEGVEGWNTLIVRTEAGEELVQAALAKGAIETAPLPEENLEHLKQAALLKKKRALRKIVDTTGSTEDLLYLKLSREVRDRLLA